MGRHREFQRAIGKGVAPACVLIAALGGCASGEAAAEDPSTVATNGTVEPTEAVEASPEPTVEVGEEVARPERPELIDGDGLDAAAAIGEYFLQLYPYVYATGDLSEWQELSHPDCQFCQSVVDNVTALHAGGGYVSGPTVEIVENVTYELVDGYEFHRVDVIVEWGEHQRIDADGEALFEEVGFLGTAVYAMDWTGERWRVRGLDIRIEEER